MDFKERDSVEFKGTGRGLVLYVHTEMLLEDIFDSISLKIRNSPTFFEDGILTEINSNYLSPYQKNLIIEFLEENFNIEYIGIDEFSFNELMKQKEYKGASAVFKAVRTLYLMDISEGDNIDYNGTIIAMTTIPKNTVIKASVDIIVLGSVDNESSIIAGGNITVMGEIRGSVYAGAYGNDSACIVARKINSEKLAIYDCQTNSVVNRRETTMTNPEICYIDEHKKLVVSQKKEILYKYSPDSISDMGHGAFGIEEQGILMEKNEKMSDYLMNFLSDNEEYYSRKNQDFYYEDEYQKDSSKKLANSDKEGFLDKFNDLYNERYDYLDKDRYQYEEEYDELKDNKSVNSNKEGFLDKFNDLYNERYDYLDKDRYQNDDIKRYKNSKNNTVDNMEEDEYYKNDKKLSLRLLKGKINKRESKDNYYDEDSYDYYEEYDNNYYEEIDSNNKKNKPSIMNKIKNINIGKIKDLFIEDEPFDSEDKINKFDENDKRGDNK